MSTSFNSALFLRTVIVGIAVSLTTLSSNSTELDKKFYESKDISGTNGIKVGDYYDGEKPWSQIINYVLSTHQNAAAVCKSKLTVANTNTVWSLPTKKQIESIAFDTVIKKDEFGRFNWGLGKVWLLDEKENEPGNFYVKDLAKFPSELTTDNENQVHNYTCVLSLAEYHSTRGTGHELIWSKITPYPVHNLNDAKSTCTGMNSDRRKWELPTREQLTVLQSETKQDTAKKLLGWDLQAYVWSTTTVNVNNVTEYLIFSLDPSYTQPLNVPESFKQAQVTCVSKPN